MLAKEFYTNGQKTQEIKGDNLIIFYKNGKVKAEGPFIHKLMENEWKFYRETGQLWQIAHFKNGMKHGSWIRFDKKNQIEYQETFENNKIVKKR